MRYRSAKEFPPIWDFARLCSFIRLEVMIKNMIFVLSTNYKSMRRGCFPRYIKKSIPINVLRHRTCITISVRPLKNIILNLIQKKKFWPIFLNFFRVWVVFYFLQPPPPSPPPPPPPPKSETSWKTINLWWISWCDFMHLDQFIYYL